MRSYLTPPQVAKLWGVKASKVLSFIHKGELEALNMATDPGKRPRYRITPDALKRFERRRATQPAPKQVRRYRPPKGKDFVEYFT